MIDRSTSGHFEPSIAAPTVDARAVGRSDDAHPTRFEIEGRSIDYVPPSERHGTPLGQVALWFWGQFNVNSVSMGFIGPAMGLSLGWTLIASLIGVIIGTIFMAFHATQGPVLGLPQMIQSRAQFGYRGVIIPLIAVLIDFVGYNVICAVIIMTGLASLFGLPPVPVVIALGVVSCCLAIYGHDWVHRAAKIFCMVNVPIFALLTLAIMTGLLSGTAPLDDSAAATGFVMVAFGTQLAACASNQIAYAPFVSDYTRYLPEKTLAWKVIAAVFSGAALSGFWSVGLGAWLATHIAASDPLTALHVAGNGLAAGLGLFIVIIAVLMNVGVLSLDNYSASLASITAADSIKSVKPSKKIRIVSTTLVTALWCGFALIGGEDVVGTLWLTLTILLYVLVPWTAVNLVDFFYVRHGHYAITDLYMPNGIYGAWGKRGLIAYAIGMISMVPFMVLPGLFTGPLVDILGGSDIAWLLGLFISGGFYWFAAPSVAHEKTAIKRSQLEIEKMNTGQDL